MKSMQYMGGCEARHARRMGVPASVEQGAAFAIKAHMHVSTRQMGAHDGVWRRRVHYPDMSNMAGRQWFAMFGADNLEAAVIAQDVRFLEFDR